MLSFDIISIIIVTNEVKNYFDSAAENLETGIGLVEGNFTLLCDSFLSLTEEVTQDNLN